MHKNRLSKKALKTSGVTSSRFPRLTREMMEDVGRRALEALDNRFPRGAEPYSISMGAPVERLRCSICDRSNCEHLSMSVEANKEVNTKGNIEFIIEGEPVLELLANGDIKVKGKLIENDKELVEGMRLFLSQAGPENWQDCPTCGARLVSSLLYYDVNIRDVLKGTISRKGEPAG